MRKRLSVLFLVTLAAVGATYTSLDPGALHFALSKSMPEADASLPSPAEVRLWFTEEPQENSVSIRLVNAAGDVVETGDLTQGEEDARTFAVTIQNRLAPGAYTVAWRGMGDDGHVVRDDFSFTVAVQ